MKPKINQRKEADQTRAAIIKSATKLFAEKGFSGTPTAAIAKAAKVNEALIFHHFGNKAELWKKVKEEITNKGRAGIINETPNSLNEFLIEAIEQRLNLYQNTPLLHRIMQWQRLEDKSGKLVSSNPSAPSSWIPAIQHLQQTNQIKKTIAPELILIWLLSSINAVIQDELKIFADHHKKEEYVALIIKGFEQTLGV